MGFSMDENERAEILLQSLPDSYDQLVVNEAKETKLIFNDVAASVLAEESRRMNKEDRLTSSQQVEALSMTRGRSTERGPSGSQKGRSKSRSKNNVRCFFCGKKGHMKKECRLYKKSIEDKGKAPENQGNVVSTSDDGEVLCTVAAITGGRKSLVDVWLLDTAASFHMTSRREWFCTYKPVSEGRVYMGNDQSLEIAGVGSIKVKMHDGIVRTIEEVRHVIGLKKNLLSVGQLDELNYKIHVEKGIIKVVRGALGVMKAEKIAANLYMLLGETLQDGDALAASTGGEEESTLIWHRKLGHMSEQGLKILSDRKLLPGLKSVDLPFCEDCVTSKQRRLKFSRSTARSKCILALIHSDVWESPGLSRF